jgi:prevent-host-death family protein
MREYTATELVDNAGDVLSVGAREEVEITRHGKPRFVLMSIERFERLLANGDLRRAARNEDLSEAEAAELIGALERSVARE